MILVDTSIWVDHLHADNPVLGALLDADEILAHPSVIGELLLGSAGRHAAIFLSFRLLPQAEVARDDEVQSFIIDNRLSGSGIGYVDAHLLVAARLTPETKLWTRDQRLLRVAERLHLAFRPDDA